MMNILNRRGFLGALAAGGAAAKGMASRLWGQVTGSTAASSEKPAYRVQSPNLTVEFSRQGEIVGLTLGAKQIRWPVQGRTSLAGCRVESTPQVEERKDGGVRFTKTLTGEFSGVRKEVTLYESFSPTKDSVRWEMRLDGHGAAWSTAIETQLEFAGAARKKFWTAWGDPEPDDPRLMTEPWPDVFFKSLKWFEAPEGPSGTTRSF